MRRKLKRKLMKIVPSFFQDPEKKFQPGGEIYVLPGKPDAQDPKRPSGKGRPPLERKRKGPGPAMAAERGWRLDVAQADGLLFTK